MKTNMISTTHTDASTTSEHQQSHSTDMRAPESRYGQCTSLSNHIPIEFSPSPSLRVRRVDGLPSIYRMTVQNHTSSLSAVYSGKTILPGEAVLYRVPTECLLTGVAEPLVVDVWHPVFQKTIRITISLERSAHPVVITGVASSNEIGVDVGISREGFFRVNIYDAVSLSSRIGTL